MVFKNVLARCSFTLHCNPVVLAFARGMSASRERDVAFEKREESRESGHGMRETGCETRSARSCQRTGTF